jgi:hypothetical protein
MIISIYDEPQEPRRISMFVQPTDDDQEFLLTQPYSNIDESMSLTLA